MHIHPSSPNSTALLQSEESAAIKIQAGFRGYRVRKQLHYQTRCTKNGYHPPPHKNSFYRSKQRQQSRQTMENTSNTRSITTGNATAAQLTDGGNKGNDEHNNNSIEDRCATKIQAGVRGFLVRKKQRIATNAATKIQASFRGFKVRKEAQKLKEN